MGDCAPYAVTYVTLPRGGRAVETTFPEGDVSLLYSSGVMYLCGVVDVPEMKFKEEPPGETDGDRSYICAIPLCLISGNFWGPLSKLNLVEPLVYALKLDGVDSLSSADAGGGMGVVAFGPRGRGAVLSPWRTTAMSPALLSSWSGVREVGGDVVVVVRR